jgi:putative transposase
VTQIRLIHGRFSYYGAPRIHRALRAKGIAVGRHRVARLMREHGIRARRGPIKSRRRSAPPSRRPEVIDRVRRRFRASAGDRLWFTDLTAIRTSEGFLRAAVILDAHSRQVITWATDAYETPKTVMRALRDAIATRRPPSGCIIHSDRGYQFTSHEWHDLAARHGLIVSLGEQKSALDNAAMESWFASLKNEDIYPGWDHQDPRRSPQPALRLHLGLQPPPTPLRPRLPHTRGLRQAGHLAVREIRARPTSII